MNARKLLPRLVTVAVLGAALPMAVAGVKRSQQVIVNTTSRVALGGAGTARNSPDPFQWIQCEVWGHSTGSVYASCEAQNSERTFASCWTNAEALVKVASTVNGDSNIQFNWGADGKCTYIYVYNSSADEPKQP